MKVDTLIIGGGIAGLWLLAELQAQNCDALLASDSLGSGQTIASQGIIHGGTKYSLTGKLTEATLAISDMPRLWYAALHGEGAVDLSHAKILAKSQLLWTTGSIGSRLTGFFASHLMKSRMETLPRESYPVLFQHSEFQGSLYQLDEPVLDIPSVLACLHKQLANALLQVDPQQSSLQKSENNYIYQALLPTGEILSIAANNIILMAGSGNENLAKNLEYSALRMQNRPLQMVLLRGDLPMTYAHALGISDKPRVTITSHRDNQGRTIWYIGGQPAEQGVGKSPVEAINATHKELADLLPWMDFKHMEWATWNVNRAEGQQPDGSRPDQPLFSQVANVTVAWPTKLAFAPMLAARLRDKLLPYRKVTDKRSHSYTVPQIAIPVWDRITHWQDVT
jgi:glycerol-3-phosphate dehydrogenase